jgi:uncharacterized protein
MLEVPFAASDGSLLFQSGLRQATTRRVYELMPLSICCSSIHGNKTLELPLCPRGRAGRRHHLGHCRHRFVDHADAGAGLSVRAQASRADHGGRSRDGQPVAILAWWREVDWRACAAYSIPGIPAAAFGARTLLALPAHAVDISIGLFLIAMVPVRHWLARHDLKFSLWHLAVGGAVIGYLTGIVVSTGPLSVPLFLFYGLTKGAFLATEAASSLGLYLSKSVTFQRFGALTPDLALKGLIAGSSLMFGAFIAKRFVLRLNDNVFRLVMDGIMIAAGLSMLANALWSAP